MLQRIGENMFYLKEAAATEVSPVVALQECGSRVARSSSLSSRLAGCVGVCGCDL